MLFREEPGDFIDCIDSNHNLFGLKLTDKKTRGRDRVIEIDTKIPLSTENHIVIDCSLIDSQHMLKQHQ